MVYFMIYFMVFVGTGFMYEEIKVTMLCHIKKIYKSKMKKS